MKQVLPIRYCWVQKSTKTTTATVTRRATIKSTQMGVTTTTMVQLDRVLLPNINSIIIQYYPG